ncbi:OTU domain-containing protein 6B-like [Mizuhopecten yessoensis]|uniref:ubiquitinyl hydrolase 1 n=1 Tax=Mizuhopecten yessoensis TaxID=6573 RepID=A0A210Q4F5_MIZYE|nr:OTU domain-containing protein 6B-like [Mizuhopecten yessoensis]OWF43630.1 OTU domain-containing protein 6B [Mizuhopecten yessoensis]
MSDTEDVEEVLSRKHKKECKDLQAQIQKLKHSVPKGDKKRKKEVTEQIAKLEHDLDERQEAELQELKETTADVANVAERLEELDTKNDDSTSDNTVGAASGQEEKKLSKAQKRRNKKLEKDREREEEIKQQDIQNLSGARHIELQKIKEALKHQNLQIFEIKSDGNCLYNAVNHQLEKIRKVSSNEALRGQVARYMKENRDDFLPFLTKDNGDMFTEEDFEKYCQDTAHTTAWGGQLEVRALSHTLKQPIKVVQSEGAPVIVGEEFENDDQPTIIVCYLRHAFGLGEHYNSVEDYKRDEDDEFS